MAIGFKKRFLARLKGGSGMGIRRRPITPSKNIFSKPIQE